MVAKFVPPGVVVVRPNLTPRPLLVAIREVVTVYCPQRELRNKIMMAKDVSAHIPDRPPIRLPEAPLCFRERRLVQPKPLPPHPLNLVRLCSFRDGRVGVTDPRVIVMGTNLFDPLHDIVRLLRFVLDHQHVDRRPGDFDFPELKRRKSVLIKLAGVATEMVRDLRLGPAPLADIDRAN